MALVLSDRTQETTTTVGTGTITLAGAVTGYQSFAAVGNGNTTYYCIAGLGTTEWEVGIGTYTSSGTTLTRTTVLASSNSNALVSFSAGTKSVFVTYPAEKSVNLDASGNASALGTPASFVGTNITGTATAFTASNVTTNANLTGEATSVGNAATLTNSAVIGKVLTGYISGAGVVAATDNILQAIQKLNGNDATNANLTGMVTSVGNATTVVTNANLTGEATSVGNAATLTNSAVIGKVLTGYTSGAGTVAATDNILQAIQKLNGNTAAIVGGATLSNDTTTATNVYPVFAAATSGVLTTVYTSNAKYLYKPSTGELSVTAPLASNGLVMNNMTVATSYTIPTGYSASSIGPVTVSGGVAITIPSGSRWVVF